MLEIFLGLVSLPEAWISFLTLAVLEIVLGIDNIVFITILASRLPEEQQVGARRTGLGVALVSRLVLLSLLSFIVHLQEPIFSVGELDVSIRDLILLAGGLFLIFKATKEIYEKVEAPHLDGPDGENGGGAKSYAMLMIQIMLVDMVFSLDSVITAVGMVGELGVSEGTGDELAVMAAAVIVAVIVMMVFAGPIGNFIQKHPSMKILALSFLVMIGILLVAEGMHHHFNRGFVYFGMAFSLFIEILNIRYRSKVEKLEKTPGK